MLIGLTLFLPDLRTPMENYLVYHQFCHKDPELREKPVSFFGKFSILRSTDHPAKTDEK